MLMRLTALLLCVLLLLPATARAVAPAGKPNVMIVLCDDLGYGDIGCFGNKVIRTPNLDKLAAEGVKLTRCYAAAPVCSASRVGLLTGRTPSRVGVYDWIPDEHPMHMGREELTIANLLKRAGYATGHFGKWHCNGRFNEPAQPQPSDHGFDYWFSTQNNALPSHKDPINFVRNGKPVGPLSGYSCQLVADETIHWLKSRGPSGGPFFAYVCFHEPHEKIAAPPEITAEYEKAGVTPREKAEHHADITNMDAAFGRLMAALDELHVRDNTLVIFTSDNGPETLNRYPTATHSFGSTGGLRGMKLWVYEGGIRVPGIVRWPAGAKPGVSDVPVCSLDYLPTICDLAGVPLPTDRAYDGANFLAALEGKPVARTTPLFWHYYAAIGEPKVAVIDGRDKLVGKWDVGTMGPVQRMKPADWQKVKDAKLTSFELYDLDADRGEQNDLAAQQPQKAASMAEQMKAKYAEVLKDANVWPAAPGPQGKKKGAGKE